MKQIFFLLFISMFFLSSCGPNRQERSLKERQDKVSQKEQELLAWEQRLKMQERELESSKQVLDSVKNQVDSTSVYNPAIVGKWIVKMTCTETNCEGSALGDTKTEQWEISYRNKNVLVKAYSGLVLTRVYIGRLRDNVLSIVDEKPIAEATFSATLNFIDDRRMDGVREVLQKNCKIVYQLNIQRSK